MINCLIDNAYKVGSETHKLVIGILAVVASRCSTIRVRLRTMSFPICVFHVACRPKLLCWYNTLNLQMRVFFLLWDFSTGFFVTNVDLSYLSIVIIIVIIIIIIIIFYSFSNKDTAKCNTKGPGARFSKNFTTNLWKTYEKVWLMKNLGWACDFQKKSYKNLMKNLGRSYAKLMMKLNDDITSILRRRKIRGKWCHSENFLSEAVIGRILWAKNNWQPEWRFPTNAFKNDL